MKPLSGKFWLEPAQTLAPKLLGQYLVRQWPNGQTKQALITEAEAYCGPQDEASHASRGRTARTEIMFRPGGYWYVYLIYGLYHMANIVTGPKDYPAAILIRSVENLSGPGRLTKHWQIDRAFNGQLAVPSSGLFIAAGFKVKSSDIQAGPRIGIDYASKKWREQPWRFYLKK